MTHEDGELKRVHEVGTDEQVASIEALLLQLGEEEFSHPVREEHLQSIADAFPDWTARSGFSFADPEKTFSYRLELEYDVLRAMRSNLVFGEERDSELLRLFPSTRAISYNVESGAYEHPRYGLVTDQPDTLTVTFSWGTTEPITYRDIRAILEAQRYFESPAFLSVFRHESEVATTFTLDYLRGMFKRD